jgi:tRNA pseudouridine32 synthase/23S rRNA pseudouridine746 synthase
MKISLASIIDQQEDFVVIDKPAGMNFHDEDEPGNGLFSQVKSLLARKELYPVHRLDKMTSGLIIFAKNLTTAQVFQTMFEQHLVEKYYLAIADGKPKKKQGLIKGDMVKSRRGMWKLLRTTEHPAISQFTSYSIAPARRLYLIKPHSGKTHQIRVALNSLAVPILGDTLYNNSSIADRGYLHAYALQFSLRGQCFQYQLVPNKGSEYLMATTQAHITTLKAPWSLDWPKLS